MRQPEEEDLLAEELQAGGCGGQAAGGVQGAGGDAEEGGGVVQEHVPRGAGREAHSGVAEGIISGGGVGNLRRPAAGRNETQGLVSSVNGSAGCAPRTETGPVVDSGSVATTVTITSLHLSSGHAPG